VWDRLPLAALFPLVFAVAIGDRVSPAVGRALFLPLAVAGVVSVVWWDVTDDLRPYALVQFLPAGADPLMLWLFPGRRATAPLLIGVAIYAGSKLFELGDGVILAAGGLVSGHTVKHVLSAVAAGSSSAGWRLLIRRSPRDTRPGAGRHWRARLQGNIRRASRPQNRSVDLVYTPLPWARPSRHCPT